MVANVQAPAQETRIGQSPAWYCPPPPRRHPLLPARDWGELHGLALAGVPALRDAVPWARR